MLRAAVVVALLALLALTAYWTLLYLTQRSMLYPAPPVSGAPSRPADARQVWLTTRGGNVEAWMLPPRPARAGPAPLLLFTHGNGELIDYWPEAFDEPRSRGVAVLLLEYPGYGRSAGSPSQASITEAVLAAYDWARGDQTIDDTRIVPYGRSLGGGAAAVLAERRTVPALILESTFTSVAAFAARMGAPPFLVRDRFDTLAVVRQLDRPVLVLHGDRDDLVPPSHGRAIAEAAKRATLVLMPCGHNDCPRPWGAVHAFLEAQGILEGQP